MGWDGMGWDGLGWDGRGLWDGTAYELESERAKQAQRFMEMEIWSIEVSIPPPLLFFF